MTPKTNLALFLAVCFVWALLSSTLTPAARESPSPRQQFNQYLAELKQHPDDAALREKIIKLARTLKPGPAVPAEVDELIGKALHQMKTAQSPSDYAEAAETYKQILLAAPWVADYYFNLGAALEKAGENDAAITNYRLYLTAKPEATDAREVRMHIGELKDAATKPATATATAIGMPFVKIPKGCFDMGDTFGGEYANEKPVHRVCVNEFYLGKYEVTQKLWSEVMGDNPVWGKRCDDCPVSFVSWDAVQEFIGRLNQKTGQHYRLPTEAEWEYAARSGGKKEKYAGTSNDGELGEYAWYDANSSRDTHPVGQKKPNGLGLYDMSGNVEEWTASVYKENYGGAEQRAASSSGEGGTRAIRGGSWNDTQWGKLRAASRWGLAHDSGNSNTGFRLARTP